MKALFILSVIAIIGTGCSNQTGAELFHNQVKNELASKKRMDKVFFDIRFGMKQNEFYTYCWEMNKKGIFTDGKDPKGNMYVLYKLKNDLNHPASMNFFPDFNKNSIVKMNAYFQYDGWAPWNRQLFSDSLVGDVKSFYEKEYAGGNPFIKIDNKQYAKIDGNRRIIISVVDDALVKAEITDMSAGDKE